MSVNSTLGPRKSSQSRSLGHTPGGNWQTICTKPVHMVESCGSCMIMCYAAMLLCCYAAMLLCCYATSWRDPMDDSVQARFMLRYFTLGSNLPRDLLMHHLGRGWHGGCRWQWSRGCFGSIRCIETETRRTPGHGSWTIQCKKKNIGTRTCPLGEV